MALAVAEEGILAAVGEAHRPAGRLGEQGEIDLDGHVLLAAETAADHGAQDAHLVVGHADRIGDEAEVLDHLGRDPDADDLVLVDPGEADLGLEEGVFNKLGAEAILDHQIGGGETGFRVALADLVGRDHIVRTLDQGRAGLSRVFGVVDAGQRLQLDLDQLGGLFGETKRFGGDQRQWLAVVADPLAHQNLLVGVEPLAPGLTRDVGRRQAVGQLGGGQHAGDAVERPRLGGVEAFEACAGQRSAQHLNVQHARHDVVAGVVGPALRLARRVGPHQGAADLAQVDVGRPRPVLGGPSHAALPFSRKVRAASRTASNTLV